MLNVNESLSQWTFNTMGNNYSNPFNPNSIANTNGTVAVNYTGQRLRSNIVPEGLVLKGLFLYDPIVYNQALNDGIQQALTTIPIEKWFKATVGKNDTIRLNYQYNKYNNVAGRPQQVNNSIANFNVLLGSKEAGAQYQNTGANPILINETINASNVVTGSLRCPIKFPKGTTRGYVIIPIQETVTNFSQLCSRSLPPVCNWYDANLDNIIILPFVVEGPIIDLSSPTGGATILGRFREPAIPQMILHNPPGDGSSATFRVDQKACRTMSQSLTTEESNTGKLNVTLGIAGSAGLFVTTDFEFSVTASVSVGAGGAALSSTGQQNCVSITNEISTVPGFAPANEGSIYLVYSSEIAYGTFPRVLIDTSTPTILVEKDTAVIFGVVPNSATAAYHSKNTIKNDIVQRQAIINNPATTPKNRFEAQNQINIWKQVLAKDSMNINDPNAEVISPTSTLPEGGVITSSFTQSVTSSDSYDVSNFLEIGAGVSFVIKVGGSGVDGGYEFKTKKTMGRSVSRTATSSSTIGYRLYDDDDDTIVFKIIKDKTYGTPIFLLDSAQSRTSAPYEGGYKRDQPSLRFNAVPTSNSYTVPNVPLGQPSIFAVNICNNSNETRTYNLGIRPVTNGNDASIRMTGSTGTIEFGDFPIAPNACDPRNFFISVTQPNLAALSSPDLNFQLYAFKERAIASNIFVTCNWGSYALPTGISTEQTSICQGANANLSLTANCEPGTTTTWYNTAAGGSQIGTGSPFSQLPTVNTNYYVSCISGIYNYKRLPSNSVTVNPTPTPPIVTASGPLTFCSPGSVTLKSYAPSNNKVMNFIRANSQYITVPHSASLNLAGTLTMEAWVRYSGSNSTFIDKGNYNFLWSLNANSNGNKMGFYTRNTGSWVYSTGIVPENTWTHVAITLNAGTLTFYINGVASGTAAVTFSQDNQPMNIGRQQPTFCVCNHFNGIMDELRLWNIARTQAQIQSNMNSSSIAANSTGLVAYYTFNESSSTTDATTNRNNGILINGPTRQLLETVPFNEIPSLWMPSNTNVSSITASNAGTYTASLSNTFGCAGSASLVVNALASPMPTPQAPAYIPTGGGVSLTATGCSGSLGTYSLKWYKSTDNTLVTMPVSPAATTNYYAKCEQTLNSITCIGLASANVTVNVGNVVNSIISRNWESTNTWFPSRVPLPTDVVIINNHTVTITSNAANAKSLEYKSGATLRYLNAAAKLNVGF